MRDHPDLHRSDYQQIFTEIQAFYADLGVPIVGTWLDSLHPAEDMFDTRYHLHREASIIRSAKLGKQIYSIINRNE